MRGLDLNNQRARPFYRRWGFADVGTHIFQLGVLMQRRLNPDVEEPARDATIVGEDVTTSGPM